MVTEMGIIGGCHLNLGFEAKGELRYGNRFWKGINEV